MKLVHNKMIFAATILATLTLAQPSAESIKCPKGQQLRSGLCYEMITQAPPIPTIAPMKKAVGTVPKLIKRANENFDPRCRKTRAIFGCTEGKVEGAGLCYTPCGEGWTGRGPVCWKGWRSYGRGVGTRMQNICPAGVFNFPPLPILF